MSFFLTSLVLTVRTNQQVFAVFEIAPVKSILFSELTVKFYLGRFALAFGRSFEVRTEE